MVLLIRHRQILCYGLIMGMGPLIAGIIHQIINFNLNTKKLCYLIKI